MQKAEKWMLEVSMQMKNMNDQEKIILFKQDFEEIEKKLKTNSNDMSLLGSYKGIFGYMYLRGWGVEKDNNKAFLLLKKPWHEMGLH